jgi:hypothetical protein
MGWVVSVTVRPRFSSRKGPPVPIVQEAGWAPAPVWTPRLEEKSFRLCLGSNLDRPVVQPVVRHYTDWATRPIPTYVRGLNRPSWVSLSTAVSQHTYGGAVGERMYSSYSFTTSALDEGECLLSRPAGLIYDRINCMKRAVLWLRRLVAGLSPRTPDFAPVSVNVGFVVKKSGTWTGLSQSSSVFPVNIILL